MKAYAVLGELANSSGDPCDSQRVGNNRGVNPPLSVKNYDIIHFGVGVILTYATHFFRTGERPVHNGYIYYLRIDTYLQNSNKTGLKYHRGVVLTHDFSID